MSTWHSIAAWRARSRAAVRAARLVGTAAFFILCVAVGGRAQAASPGGVSGAKLWFTGGGFNGTTWTDQSGAGIVSAQPTAPTGASSPSTIALDSNFNPGVLFDGSTQWLRATTNTNVLGAAKTYIFGVSNWNGTTSTFDGGLLTGYVSAGAASEGLAFAPGVPAYIADADLDSQPGFFTVNVSGATPYILSDCYFPNAALLGATASENGLTGSSATSTTSMVTATNQFELGGRTADDTVSASYNTRLFEGSIDEAIYYTGTTLTSTQISQIRSYLAIKYGITLGYNTSSGSSTGTDYLSSAGATVWSGASNPPYQYDVAGIARDAASGLDQRVSHSVNPTPAPNAIDVTIANYKTISTTSPSANTDLASDQTFVMWGDNNGTTTISSISGINRMGRVWRTQTTGTGSTYLTVQVPSASLGGVSNPVIWVASDANFQTSATATTLTCGSTYCTVTIPTFTSGSTQYFTFGTLGLSGTVFEDVNYGGGAGRGKTTSGGVGISGARAELYSSAGAFVSATTTASDGTYAFNAYPGTFTVRVVTPSTSSRTGGTAAGLLAVQTYRTDATGGSAAAVTDHVGGEKPSVADAASNTTSATLASLSTSTTAAQSVTTVTISTADVGSVDFGFNFDTVVNGNDTGQGSLYQFITNANALGGVASLAQVGQTAGTQTTIFMISDGNAHGGLRNGIASGLTGGVAVFTPSTSAAQYPAITNAGTVIDGTTQTANVPGTNSGTLGTGGTVGTDALALSTIAKPTVQIMGTSSTTVPIGITIDAANTTIRGIAIYGFGTASGISGDIVINASASSGTLIEKNAIGTSATSFTSPGTISGEGIYVNGSGGGTIQNNVIGYITETPLRMASTSGWTVSGNELRSAYASRATSGIWAQNSSSITFSGNLIAANPAAGISLSAASGAIIISDNTISGNGIAISGQAPSLTPGLSLAGTGAGNTITKNVISGNYGAGIGVMNGSTQNTLSQNSIYGNGTIVAADGSAASGQIGIDLETDTSGTGASPYITPNVSGGTGTGGNNLFAFPVLDGASIASGTYLIVTGWARPGATIELFLADASPASGFGQGKTYLTTVTEGSTTSPVDTDATSSTYNDPNANTHVGTDTTSRFRFTIALPSGVSAGSVITATSTLAANGTSEFGPNITVTTVSVPTIVTTLTVSPGSGYVPGAVLTYTGTFKNTGTGSASTISLLDPIPTQTDFLIGSAATSVSGTGLSSPLVNYYNGTTSMWNYTPVSGGGGAPSSYDRLVTQVKFSFSGTLAASQSASFSFSVRIQ